MPTDVRALARILTRDPTDTRATVAPGQLSSVSPYIVNVGGMELAVTRRADTAYTATQRVVVFRFGNEVWISEPMRVA